MSSRKKQCEKDGHIVHCQDNGFWYCLYCYTKIDTDE